MEEGVKLVRKLGGIVRAPASDFDAVSSDKHRGGGWDVDAAGVAARRVSTTATARKAREWAAVVEMRKESGKPNPNLKKSL